MAAEAADSWDADSFEAAEPVAKRLVPGVAVDRWAGEDEEDNVKVRPGGPRRAAPARGRPRGPGGGERRIGAGPGRCRAGPPVRGRGGEAGPGARGPGRGGGGPRGGEGKPPAGAIRAAGTPPGRKRAPGGKGSGRCQLPRGSAERSGRLCPLPPRPRSGRPLLPRLGPAGRADDLLPRRGLCWSLREPPAAPRLPAGLLGAVRRLPALPSPPAAGPALALEPVRRWVGCRELCLCCCSGSGASVVWHCGFASILLLPRTPQAQLEVQQPGCSSGCGSAWIPSGLFTSGTAGGCRVLCLRGAGIKL
ncbi:uncharacterized protein [Melanerpes formicivorus]|uniref:uncharacterized protein n=1 Tax=Melanerpes formicivorus TaxID=211600 RepID=UPI00358DDA4D